MKNLSFAAAFVLDHERRLLCVQERFDFDNNHYWIIPGGGIDDGETPEQAAARETREEAGVLISGTPVRLFEINIYHPTATLNCHGIYYPAYSGDMKPSDPDIIKAEFLPIAQARTHIGKINNSMRSDPIFAVLDRIEAQQDLEFFRWDYYTDENENLIEKKIVV